MNSSRLGSHAVVIGGSIAGLVSARVLSDYFDKVTILERDLAPTGPDARKGAPQMRHAHILLNAANMTLEGFFPGITAELTAAGASLIDCGVDAVIHHYGNWKPRVEVGFHAICCSRPFLEWHVRRRTEALPNVEVRYGVPVDALKTNERKDTVTGVIVKKEDQEETIAADLVVDAAGRGTRTPRWLESLGYGRPVEQEVKVDLAYTSRIYERPPNIPGKWKVMAIYWRPPGQRGGFLFDIEHDRWIASFPGYFKDHCPTDEAGFLEFAKSLPAPDIYDAIRNAKPLSEIVTHKMPSSRWFRYDKMSRLPERLLMVGDSVVSLNPVYGQGMLMSVQGIKEVARLLEKRARKRQGLQGLPQAAQAKIAQTILPAWLLSTTMDLRNPKAIGERPLGFGLVQRILGDVIDVSSLDPDACRVFYEMLHMRQGFGAILDRRLLGPLLKYSVRNAFAHPNKQFAYQPMPVVPE